MLHITPQSPPVLLRGAAEPPQEIVKKGLQFLAAFSAIAGIVWLASSFPRPKKRALAGALRGVQVGDEEGLALELMDWHGGQGSAAYAVGSSWHAGKKVDTDLVREAADELRSVVRQAKKRKQPAPRGAIKLAKRLEAFASMADEGGYRD